MFGFEYAFKFKVTGYQCDLPENHQISQIVLGVLETTFDGAGDQFNWKGDIPDQVLRYLKGELEAYIKIPTSGFFKGKGFYGSRAERQELVKVFKDAIHDMAARNPGWSVFSWPDVWYEMDGIEFMQTYMERPRSVHLARRYYRWDLVENVPNPRLKELATVRPKSSFLEF